MSNFVAYINIGQFSRKKKIRFCINIGVGIAIAVLFHFLENTGRGEDMINKAFDHVLLMEAEKAAGSAKSLKESKNSNISDRIVFVDIDHDTYMRWGEPYITPRDRLAEIIDAANNAAIIVLDILLENEECCHPGNDTKLRNVLQKMTDDQSSTKIIFPVRVGFKGDIKKNIFSDIIEANPRFYYAIPNLSATATDRVIRYWSPYEIIEDNGQSVLLWNISFLAAMLANEKSDELQSVEKIIRGDNRSATYSISLKNGKNLEFSAERDDLYRYRIRFLRIPANILDGYAGGNLFEDVYMADEVLHAPLKNKIVIIGNSSPDAGDKYPTPIGEMPGMYIIGNALNTILLGMQPSSSVWWINVLIEIVAIIMAAYFFLYFTSLLAKIIVSSFLIITLGTAGYYYFIHTGVFLNFVFPIAGMGLHRTISDLEEIFEMKGVREH